MYSVLNIIHYCKINAMFYDYIGCSILTNKQNIYDLVRTQNISVKIK